jgi:hypothetical protein
MKELVIRNKKIKGRVVKEVEDKEGKRVGYEESGCEWERRGGV